MIPKRPSVYWKRNRILFIFFRDKNKERFLFVLLYRQKKIYTFVV
jgi:hypothetical protein